MYNQSEKISKNRKGGLYFILDKKLKKKLQYTAALTVTHPQLHLVLPILHTASKQNTRKAQERLTSLHLRKMLLHIHIGGQKM